eukprot:3561085-Pyramimonas_sp.AAC.1
MTIVVLTPGYGWVLRQANSFSFARALQSPRQRAQRNAEPSRRARGRLRWSLYWATKRVRGVSKWVCGTHAGTPTGTF